jgi:DNA mismatch repair protein MutS
MVVDEGGHAALSRGRRRKVDPSSQLGLFGAPPDPAAARLREELAALDLDALRPIDALNLIAEWKKRLS